MPSGTPASGVVDVAEFIDSQPVGTHISLERSYTELLAQGSLARKAALDVDGIRAVLELRRRFAPSPPPSSDPARYYDLSYYEKALSR